MRSRATRADMSFLRLSGRNQGSSSHTASAIARRVGRELTRPRTTSSSSSVNRVRSSDAIRSRPRPRQRVAPDGKIRLGRRIGQEPCERRIAWCPPAGFSAGVEIAGEVGERVTAGS